MEDRQLRLRIQNSTVSTPCNTAKSKKIENRPKTPHNNKKVHFPPQKKPINRKKTVMTTTGKKIAARKLTGTRPGQPVKPVRRRSITALDKPVKVINTVKPAKSSQPVNLAKSSQPVKPVVQGQLAATEVYLCFKCDKKYKTRRGLANHMPKCTK